MSATDYGILRRIALKMGKFRDGLGDRFNFMGDP